MSINLHQDFLHVGHRGLPSMLVLGFYVEIRQRAGVGAHFGQRVGADPHEVVSLSVKRVVMRVVVDAADPVSLRVAARFSVLNPTVMIGWAGCVRARYFAPLRGTSAFRGAGVIGPEFRANRVVFAIVPTPALTAGDTAVVVEKIATVAHASFHTRQAAAGRSHRVDTGSRAGCRACFIVTVAWTVNGWRKQKLCHRSESITLINSLCYLFTGNYFIRSAMIRQLQFYLVMVSAAPIDARLVSRKWKLPRFYCNCRRARCTMKPKTMRQPVQCFHVVLVPNNFFS